MTKLVLQDVANFQNESTAVTALKSNNDATKAAVEITLSRDGTTPNQMLSNLDMNNYKVINLPNALTSQEPATYGQLNAATSAIGSGAVINADYVTLTNNPTLLSERVLTQGAYTSKVDTGPGGTVTIDVSDPELVALANTTSATDTVPYYTGVGTASTNPLTPYARTLIDDVDAATARTTLGSVIGTNVQAWDTDLDAVAGLATTGLIARTGAGTANTRTITGTANEITSTNGDGVAGNPTVSLPSALTFTGKTVTGGTYASPTNTGTSTIPSIVGGSAAADTVLIKSTSSGSPSGDSASIQGTTINLRSPIGGGSTINLGAAGATGAQINIAGTTSGSTLFQASPVASGTMTLPAASDTLVGKATTDTFTNKTFDTAGTGNSFKINGTSLTTVTGTGANVLATSPTLTTPVVAAGTPTTGGALGFGSGVLNYGDGAANHNVVSTDQTQTLTSKTLTSPTLTTPTLTSPLVNSGSLSVTGADANFAAGGNRSFMDFASPKTRMGSLNGGGTATTLDLINNNAAVLSFNTSGVGTFPNATTMSGALTYGGVALNNAVTGTGNMVLSTSPTLTTPALGTPSAAVLTNATGLPLSGLNTEAAFTFVGNNTSGTASPTAVDIAGLTVKGSPASTDLVMISDQAASGAWKKATVSSLASAGSVASIDALTGTFTTANGVTAAGNVIGLTAARRTLPTTQVFTTGTSLTYTTPANCLWIAVHISGGGGGGGGSGGAGAGGGGAGGTTTFNSITAIGGNPGAAATAATQGNGGGAGGTGGTGTAVYRIPGAGGGHGGIGVATVTNGPPGVGGAGHISHGGGGGPSAGNGVGGAGAGGGGEYAYIIQTTPAATYTYTVGAGGTAGAVGSGGGAGSAGQAGKIVVIEYYGT